MAEPDRILARLDRVIEMPTDALAASAPALAEELLALGEAILEDWVRAHGATPTAERVEGFRLLALHRQGTRGEPSFNACRETCRELVYHRNLIRSDPTHAEVARRVRLAAMVARHLALFVGGKLEVAGLGTFCCSSGALREQDSAAPAATVENQERI
jgi:hypothetical protein